MWSIAGGVSSTLIYRTLIKLNKILPGLITSTFDCYEMLKWMGGRAFMKVPMLSPDTFVERVNSLNENNIGVNFTFTNSNIDPKILDDYWGNYFLHNCHRRMNGVICSGNIMPNYVKNNYPQFKILGSSVLQKFDIDTLKQYQEKFDILILPPELNTQYDLIEQLNPEKIEIMVSETCLPYCQVKKLHYQLINNWNYSHDLADLDKLLKFPLNQQSCFYRYSNEDISKNQLHLSKEDILRYKSIGIKSFKIQDRESEGMTIQNIYKFLIQYSDDPPEIKQNMLNCLPRILSPRISGGD